MVLEAASSTVTAAGATLRISKIIYELKAVGEQTQDLLDSTKHVSSTLQSARTVRRQKSQYLSTDEKKWVDGVLSDTDRCLRDLAALVEPARVDLQTGSGRIGFMNRGLWVFRDSPKVATSLARLNLTSQSLNSAIMVLYSKGAPTTSIHIEGTVLNSIQPRISDHKDTKLPLPSYQESEFLHRRRISRSSSNLDLAAARDSKEPINPQSGPFLAPLSFETTIDKDTESLIAELEAFELTLKATPETAPIVNVTEVTTPTPLTSGPEFPQDNSSSQQFPTFFCSDARIPYMPPDCSRPETMQRRNHTDELPLLKGFYPRDSLISEPTQPEPELPIPVEYSRLESGLPIPVESSKLEPDLPILVEPKQYDHPACLIPGGLRKPQSVSSFSSIPSEGNCFLGTNLSKTSSAPPTRVKSRGRARLESQAGL